MATYTQQQQYHTLPAGMSAAESQQGVLNTQSRNSDAQMSSPELELPEHDDSPLAQMGFLKDFNAEKKQTKGLS